MSNNNTSEVLNTLESLYAKKEFEKGIELLKSKESLFDPANFHFNLGTFLLKLDQFPLARYHLELAKEMGFEPSMAKNNLKFVVHNLGVERVEKPKSLYSRLEQSIDSFSTNSVFGVVLSIVLLGLFLLQRTKMLRYPLIALFLSSGVLGYKYYLAENKGKQAIVLEKSALREGPSGVFDITGEVPAGLKVKVSDLREEKWYFVEAPEEFVGWINRNNLKFLDISSL